MTTLTAFQPQPFPRLHLLQRCAQADVVVLMDEVQFSGKNGVGRGPSGQRHLFLGPDPGRGAPRPIAIPIAKGSSRMPIKDVHLASEDHGPWRNQLVARVQNIYRVLDTDDLVEFLTDALATDSLMGLSRLSIDLALAALGVPGQQTLLGSDFALGPDISGSDRVLAYCVQAGAEVYLCGEPSLGYLDLDSFRNAGVKVVVQRWDPIPYPQHWGYWLPNLSWLDATLHELTLRRATAGR